MDMLVINPELTGEELLSHIINLDTYQSHLDCKRLFVSQKIVEHMA
jgi:hypothetical protein